MAWDTSPLVLVIGFILWPFFSKILPKQTRPINDIISKNLTVSIVLLYYFLVKMSEYVPSMSPVFLSTSFGVLLSASITKDQTNNQKILDDEQKRDRVIDSLLTEINAHVQTLHGGYMEEFLTFSFDGIIASGLYTCLPPESQEIVSRYYQGCHQVNNFVQTIQMTLRELADTPVQAIRMRIRTDRPEVIANLEALRPQEGD